MESRSDVAVGEAANVMEEVFTFSWLLLLLLLLLGRESTWGGSRFVTAVVGG